MTTFEEYMKMPYKLEIIPDADEGGFVASYPELPGCITCGETLDEAVSNALDAKKAWVLAAMEEGIEIAAPEALGESAESYSGQFKLRIPKSLHKTLAEDSRKEGVSMNQYCVYLLSKNAEREHLLVRRR
ncbi:MAG: type II toxin-antitoxin system HicB family antitoxin [Spirochaetaceae bacterium]|nr:type II toxin-antitoxin system HicB family antitoxin [Spirochaetaceae bacterium]MBR2362452.1 type II toxin-antitoxin system HicB family antitoxin [Spirochaetaceae bacterium]